LNTRKNLMVDSRKIHRLATRLGTSESEAVRRAVDELLARSSGGATRGLTLRGLTDLLRGAPPVDEDFADDLERVPFRLEELLEGQTVLQERRLRRKDGSDFVGEFHATVYIRWSGAPATCVYGAAQPEQETMRFDYAVVAAGRVGTAVRTVCLRSPFADTCADWLPSAPPAGWAGSQVLTGGAHQGWPVVITLAPTGGAPPGPPRRDVYTAVRWPTPAPAFQDGDPLYERPHWEELVGQ